LAGASVENGPLAGWFDSFNFGAVILMVWTLMLATSFECPRFHCELDSILWLTLPIYCRVTNVETRFRFNRGRLAKM
jgi:hypothetical protein